MIDPQPLQPISSPSMTPALALRDIAGVAKRNLLRIARTPQMLLIGALQPAMLLVLFRYVLGGAIHVPGGRYVDYVVPAVFLEAVLIGGMTTSIGLAQDLHSGIIDRFRSLPMARSAVLAGRTLADISRSLVSLAIMIALGLLVGFRFHNNAGSIIAGIALIIAFGYAFSWVYATIGLATKDPETAQVAGVLPFFILMFASNAIVPVSTMPSWLQGFARDQPLSVTIAAVRALLEGGPAGHWVWQSLASPHRAVVAPMVNYISSLHREWSDLTLTVILPEIVVRHFWHRLLHNRTSARLRRVLRPLRKIVVTTVPFHLTS